MPSLPLQYAVPAPAVCRLRPCSMPSLPPQYAFPASQYAFPALQNAVSNLWHVGNMRHRFRHPSGKESLSPTAGAVPDVGKTYL